MRCSCIHGTLWSFESLVEYDRKTTFSPRCLFSPRFAKVTASRHVYTVINRETVPTNTDRVLIATTLPWCSHGLVPGSTTVVRVQAGVPGFTMVKSGVVPFVYGGVLMTTGHATVLLRCFPVLKIG